MGNPSKGADNYHRLIPQHVRRKQEDQEEACRPVRVLWKVGVGDHLTWNVSELGKVLENVVVRGHHSLKEAHGTQEQRNL